MTVIGNARVFTGGRLSEPSDVTLEGSVIAAVAPTSASQGAPPPDVDGTGKVLMAGLIDSHIHLSGRPELVAMAQAGVTTAVDLGTHPPSLVDSLRNLDALTDIRSAGSAASAPGSTQTTLMGFPDSSVVHRPEDAAAYVAARVSEHVDLIKIIVEDPAVTGAALSAESITAVVTSAQARGLQTVAHATTPAAFRLAVFAGVDVVTHVPLQGVLDGDVIERMLVQGTICCPTLTMMQHIAAAGRAPREALGGPGATANANPESRSFDAALRAVADLHAAGVPIIAGTDANPFVGLPIHVAHGPALHDELALLIQAGLSPAEALAAATNGAATAMRLDDRGSVTPGLRADLVLVDGDPIADLSVMRIPHAVWVAGRRVSSQP